MPKSHVPHELYTFGDFRLDVPERALWHGDRRVPVADKAFDTLCALVRHANRLVSKDQLMSEVWQDTVVEENNLAKSVSAVRRILGAHAGGASFIETVRGRGFRFVAHVSVGPGTDGGGDPLQNAAPPRHRPWLAPGAIAVLAGSAVLGVLVRGEDTMRPHPAAAPRQVHATNSQAYEPLLRGNVYLDAGGIENTTKAVGAYRQAIALDPDNALAHVGLARSYLGLAYSGGRDPRGLTPLALANALRASELDPDLAEAHLALAVVRLDEWNWAEADARFRRAIELSPSLALARRNYVEYLGLVGRHDDAVREATRARHINPLTLPNYCTMAFTHFAARRYDDAVAEYEKALAIDGTQAWTHAWLAHSYRGMGMPAKAIDAYQAAIRLGDGSTSLQIFLGSAYARAGDHRQARAILETLLAGRRYVAPGELAALYASLGERDRAFALLEEAYALRDRQLQYLVIEPDFDPLRDDPRYAVLLDRVGLRN